MEKDLIKLGKEIRNARLENEITSTKFATDINVSQSYISDLENGKKKKPRIEVLERIAHYFGGSDEGAVKYLYLTFLELAGYKNERNVLAHSTEESNQNNILTLEEFFNQLDEEEKKPIQSKEFILNYKKSDDTLVTVRSNVDNDDDIFDLNTMIQNEYKTVTNLNAGMTSYGNTPLYYCGKELTHDDRIKIMKVLDAVFDIDREEYNKKLK